MISKLVALHRGPICITVYFLCCHCWLCWCGQGDCSEMVAIPAPILAWSTLHLSLPHQQRLVSSKHQTPHCILTPQHSSCWTRYGRHLVSTRAICSVPQSWIPSSLPWFTRCRCSRLPPCKTTVRDELRNMRKKHIIPRCSILLFMDDQAGCATHRGDVLARYWSRCRPV
jgi:hypothetical protein